MFVGWSWPRCSWTNLKVPTKTESFTLIQGVSAESHTSLLFEGDLLQCQPPLTSAFLT